MTVMCDVLEVSRSGYYAWLRRKPAPRRERAAQLTAEIRQVHAASRQTYGSPRVHRALQQQGVACCENTVAKLMRQCGIRSKRSKKFRVTTTDSRHAHAPSGPGKNFIRVLVGDRVRIELSPRDLTRGRIVEKIA